MTSRDTTITTTGPLFDGRALRALSRLEEDLTEVVAEQGEVDVVQFLDSALRNPTGFYQSRIRTDRIAKDRQEVSDGGVVYGPWLEGVSSRNRASTFKGYAHFRRVAQKLERNVTRITAPVTRRRVGQMNR